MAVEIKILIVAVASVTMFAGFLIGHIDAYRRHNRSKEQ